MHSTVASCMLAPQCDKANARTSLAGDSVSGAVSLRIQQLDVACETKTKDNVFVNVVVSVQYQVRFCTDAQLEYIYVFRTCFRPDRPYQKLPYFKKNLKC